MNILLLSLATLALGSPIDLSDLGRPSFGSNNHEYILNDFSGRPDEYVRLSHMSTTAPHHGCHHGFPAYTDRILPTRRTALKVTTPTYPSFTDSTPAPPHGARFIDGEWVRPHRIWVNGRPWRESDGYRR